MEKSKDPPSGAKAQSDKNRASESRQADATSSETLKDLEETQSDTELKSGVTSSDDPSAVPSPDSSSATERSGRADGSDTSEPM